jgi:hypothetical protein
MTLETGVMVSAAAGDAARQNPTAISRSIEAAAQQCFCN